MSIFCQNGKIILPFCQKRLILRKIPIFYLKIFPFFPSVWYNLRTGEESVLPQIHRNHVPHSKPISVKKSHKNEHFFRTNVNFLGKYTSTIYKGVNYLLRAHRGQWPWKWIFLEMSFIWLQKKNFR